ncbi:transmembrane protease serine 9 [Xenopus laevis]|uniref:Transmembrane protease serine 9 n=1 Tax=Xenopus laevis TaxID=8355 RepID=A0A8J0TVR5_XENLA|nr:transmembrane protease serine 9 [Xenopus laevis]
MIPLPQALLLFTLGLFGITGATECGIPLVTSRIVGGQDSQEGRWPWQVSLRFNGQHFCGGTLISNLWVVSAAHCFPNPSIASSVTVFFGSHKIDQPDDNEVSIAVKRVYNNPTYHNEGDSGDISLIELVKEVTYTNYILPVCLPDANVTFPRGLKCWVTGFGNIKSDSILPSPKTLQEVAVPLIGATECDGYYQTPTSAGTSTLRVHNDMICAGYLNGGKDSCQGDSGGPLVCSTGYQWFLAGVVSFGEGCGEPYRPGVYTLLTKYNDWIASIVRDISVNVKSATFSGPIISLNNTAPAIIASTLHISWITTILLLFGGNRNRKLHPSQETRCCHTDKMRLCLWAVAGCCLLAGCTVTAASSGCGQPIFSDRIVGGNNAVFGKWPWQASILNQNSHVCGGSLVSSNWVVSAAHCFPRSFKIENLRVLLGCNSLTNLTSEAVITRVKRVITYPLYKGDGSSGDISLVEMESPIIYSSYILPICVPFQNDDFPSGKMCWVTGWGDIQTDVSLPPPYSLQEVEVPLISASSCNNMYHYNSDLDPATKLVFEDMICAGYPEGQKDACQGDSGGPLACKSGNSWFLTGTVSWGDGCAEPNRPGVYTKVSSFSFWINQYISLNANVTMPTPFGSSSLTKSSPAKEVVTNTDYKSSINSVGLGVHGPAWLLGATLLASIFRGF